MIQFRLKFLLLCLSVCLSGCFTSIENTGPKSSSLSPSPIPSAGGNGDGYSGRRFYLIEPGYACENSSGVTVTSYKAMVSTSANGQLYLHGDLCSDFGEKPIAQSDIENSFDENVVGYGAGIYEALSKPPASVEVSPDDVLTVYDRHYIAWCISDTVDAEQMEFLVARQGNIDNPQHHLTLFAKRDGQIQKTADIPALVYTQGLIRFIETLTGTKTLFSEIELSPMPIKYGRVRIETPSERLFASRVRCRAL